MNERGIKNFAIALSLINVKLPTQIDSRANNEHANNNTREIKRTSTKSNTSNARLLNEKMTEELSSPKHHERRHDNTYEQDTRPRKSNFKNKKSSRNKSNIVSSAKRNYGRQTYAFPIRIMQRSFGFREIVTSLRMIYCVGNIVL